MCFGPECEIKTLDFVASNRRTTLRFLGFRVTDERGPVPGTGACSRKGAVYVTGGCGGYSLDSCQVYTSNPPPPGPGFFQSGAQFARKE